MASRAGDEGARLHRAFLMLLFAALIALPCTAVAQSDRSYDEFQVKSAFLYNFLLFVEWPEESFETDESPFIIAVAGDDRIQPHLKAIAEKRTAKSRPIVIRRFDPEDPVPNCHILHIPRSAEENLPELLKTANETATLTTSDISGFARRGGMIELTLIENRVNFRINKTSAEEEGLTLSSQLLKLAAEVIERNADGGAQ